MEWETSKILGGVDASTESGFTMPTIPVFPPCSSYNDIRYPFTAIEFQY